MKRKIVTFLLATTIVANVTACGNSSNSSTEKESATAEVQSTNIEKETPAKDLPDGDYQDTGVGTMYLSTVGGTSENGNVPVVYSGSDDVLIQIGVATEGFDGSKLSYIYVDGSLNSKEQLGDGQTSIDLTDDLLSVGTHKVEVLQYNNDDASSDVVTYKSASYEVKAK